MTERANWNWFGSSAISWIEKTLHVGKKYRVFGKAGFFMNTVQITHPEIEEVTGPDTETKFYLEPVYPSTEKLKARNLGGRQIAKLTYTLLQMLSEKDIPENLPSSVILTIPTCKKI